MAVKLECCGQAMKKVWSISKGQQSGWLCEKCRRSAIVNEVAGQKVYLGKDNFQDNFLDKKLEG